MQETPVTPDTNELEHHPLGFSRWDRRWNCAYSMKAEEGKEDVVSSAGEAGNRIHRHLELGTDSDDPEEQELIEVARSMAAEVSVEPFTHVEETLPLHGSDGHVICFGTLDARRVDGRRFTVVDYKTGYKLPDPTTSLKQLGGQAAALMQRYPILSGGRVVAVYPRLQETQSLTVEREDLPKIVAWAEEMERRATEAKPEDINPGPWCTYCRAWDCPAVADAGRELVKADSLDLVGGARLVELLDLCEIVKPMVDKVRSRARNLLRNGEELPPSRDGRQWKLKQKRGNRKITDNAKLAKAIEDVVPIQDLLQDASLSITKVENLYAARRHDGGHCTKKAAKEELAERLAAVVKRGSGKTELTKE